MNLESVVNSQREYFHTNVTRDTTFRKESLQKLLESIVEHESAIYDALKADLGKSRSEVYLTEVSMVIDEIKDAIKNLDKWAAPKKVHTPWKLFPAKSYVFKEPFGVALIIAPWNYPFQLSMIPLIGAIAAGNCAVVKVSKNSPYTSRAVMDIVNSTFDRRYVYVLEENLPYDEITGQDYDYIFFTGSERVGKTIMRVAADNLTPVTLELGGKSPCIVDNSADIDISAKRIMWGKLLNAGQTCVAPDYVLVHDSVKQQLVDKLKQYSKQFVGDPFANDDYPRIVNLHHYMRLKNLISKEENVIGGRGDDRQLRIEPTIIPDATFNSPFMKEEIFGPVLPVISYEDSEEMIYMLRRRPKPLACYIFSENRKLINYIEDTLSFGCGCVNDTMLQLANGNLPFGGVGASGMGSYHGKRSFDTFSHEKSMLHNATSPDAAQRYSLYEEKNTRR